MITKRKYKCTVVHPETGLTFEVFLVDCFIEIFDTVGGTSFVFSHRFCETATGQQVTHQIDKKGIWIIHTEVNNWYVKEIKEK